MKLAAPEVYHSHCSVAVLFTKRVFFCIRCLSGGGCNDQSTDGAADRCSISRLLKCNNNFSAAELCQSENAGDHVALIPGGDIPELQ